MVLDLLDCCKTQFSVWIQYQVGVKGIMAIWLQSRPFFTKRIFATWLVIIDTTSAIFHGHPPFLESGDDFNHQCWVKTRWWVADHFCRWPFLSVTNVQIGDINHFGQWPIFTDHWSLTNEQKGDLNTVKQLAGGASSGYKMIGERWRLFWFVWEKVRHVNNSDQLPERALVGGRHWKTLVGEKHWWAVDIGRHWWVEDIGGWKTLVGGRQPGKWHQ